MSECPQLDALFHQPARTRIALQLMGRGEVSFSELKSALSLTNGNLDAHLRKLAAAGYLTTRATSGPRPATFYSFSPAGRDAFRAYLSALALLLRQV